MSQSSSTVTDQRSPLVGKPGSRYDQAVRVRTCGRIAARVRLSRRRRSLATQPARTAGRSGSGHPSGANSRCLGSARLGPVYPNGSRAGEDTEATSYAGIPAIRRLRRKTRKVCSSRRSPSATPSHPSRTLPPRAARGLCARVAAERDQAVQVHNGSRCDRAPAPGVQSEKPSGLARGGPVASEGCPQIGIGLGLRDVNGDKIADSSLAGLHVG